MTIPTSEIRIPNRLFFRIGDVAKLLGVKPHVLRYWESEFKSISPQKSASGQRVYRRADVETLVLIKRLLHEERFSIEGARKKLRELKRLPEGVTVDQALEMTAQLEEVQDQASSSPLDELLSMSETRRNALIEIRDLARELVELSRLPLPGASF